MLIDCDSCAMRDRACGDCVVTVLLGTPSVRPDDVPGTDEIVASATPVPSQVELDGAERAAIAVLAGQGLVPPLRLVTRTDVAEPPEATQHVIEGTGDASHGRPPRAEAG